MHIHKIHRQKHFDFLNENRQDPITGDLIVAGNEVVFCDECKSAFLKETWEYLGGKHCDSSKTLIDFPIQKTLELRVLQDVNSLLFPIKGSENESFESFGYKLDDYFWKKIKVNLRIDAQIQKNIDSNLSLSIPVLEKNSLYILMGFVVFICLILGLVIDFSTTGYIFLIAIALGAIFLPLTFTEYDTRGMEGYELFSFLDKKRALLHFKEDAVLVYFNESKSAYSIEYTDITQIVFSNQNITICTTNAHQNTFRLVEISSEQIEKIIHCVYKLSSSTLMIFKNQHPIIKKLVKSLETEYKSIWIK
ncbi:hypothetical protein V9L05_15900 [Bernardetia sp. Wsw4-3y2]|uniref:hypothetical protein n=1 Tax=Bernardetia sp. Wsw4-3y2 TaxID=3127471 RepID=UPI0030D55476